MLSWKRQRAALVADVRLATGGHGTIIVMGPRHEAKGAALALPKPGGEPETIFFPAAMDYLSAETILAVLAAQEREHGGVLTPLSGVGP